MTGHNIWFNSIIQVRLWSHLGYRELRSKYSRTLLGPWWSSVTLLMFSTGLAIVYSFIFSVDLREFLPYVLTGLLAWNLIQSFVGDGIGVFQANRSFILNLTISIPIFALQTTWRNLLAFLHSLVAAFFVLALLGIWPALPIFQLPLSLALVAVFGASITFIVAALSARHPDLSQFIPALLQMVFFISPILWPIEAVGNRAWLFEFNPVYYLVSLIRSPLLGIYISPQEWLISLGLCLCMFVIAALIAPKTQRRAPYWL